MLCKFFQSLALKNYAKKTIHIVAYLKKIKKSEFKYVDVYKYFVDLGFNSWIGGYSKNVL